MEKIDVLCFGGEDWWYHNRGHIDMQLMQRFAKKGIAIYINSIIMQKLNLGRSRKFLQKFIRKAKSISKGLQKTKQGLWIYSPFSLPIQHISWMKWLNEILLQFQIWHVQKKIKMDTPVVWVACPSACDIAIKIKKKKLIYQRTDRFEDFPGVAGEGIKRYDQKLKANADMTVYVNRTLYEQEASQCKKAFYLDHGVDFEMFASAENSSTEPSDIAGIPKPIIGFIGSIDDCNPDIEFLGKVADLLPRMSFALIGRSQTDCFCLISRKNIWLLGQKPYELVPEYGKCFDVAILPLKQNRWTQAVNPLKLKEYLALGKPIVSTPFPELQKYLDVVYEAKTPADFAQCIEKAIFENSPELVAKRRKKIEYASWDNKAQLVLEQLLGNETAIQEPA
jgi:glycosyltransferase involved in cell wall biosynthesis